MSLTISSTRAIEILDSRGKPTVRAFVTLSDGSTHTASVPSGASTGIHEAVELRDEDAQRFFGQGVTKAVDHVNNEINHALQGKEIDPKEIDTTMINLDGTENKEKLGANAILAVSEAAIRAGAHAQNLPLWKYINQYYFPDEQTAFPRWFVNVINGGKHADWNFDIQEFIICPRESTPTQAYQVAAEIFQQIGKDLKKKGLSKLVGDEGGYSPRLSSNEEAFELVIESANNCGYTNGTDYEIAIDAAASEFFENGSYLFKKQNKTLSSKELLAYYEKMREKYHVFSMEDPFEEDGWSDFQTMIESANEGFVVVGDDLLATNPKRIKQAIEQKAATGIIIKPNQIGSIKETVESIQLARSAGWKVIVSHRSGETEDPFIADLAYGAASDFIKTGSTCRSERLAKYNRLLEIEHGF